VGPGAVALVADPEPEPLRRDQVVADRTCFVAQDVDPIAGERGEPLGVVHQRAVLDLTREQDDRSEPDHAQEDTESPKET